MSFEFSHYNPEEDPDKLFISLTDKESYEKNIRTVLSGGVASWAGRIMEQQGQFILPKQAYLERTGDDLHKVLWVEHIDVDAVNYETQRQHLAVCDCSGYSGSDEMLFCGIYENALHERAAYTALKNHINDIVSSYNGRDLSDYEKRFDIDSFLIATIEHILLVDKHTPQEWVANPRSGEHQIGLLSEILGQPEDLVREYAEVLQYEGKIQFENDTLRLVA
jgi:hypothetical protein